VVRKRYPSARQIAKNPRKYTEADKRRILKLVLNRLPDKESLREAIGKLGPHESTIHNWINSLGMSQEYARVRELRADSQFEYMIRIAYKAARGEIDAYSARVSTDILKWVMGRQARHKYGEKTQVEVNVQGNAQLIEFVKKLSAASPRPEPIDITDAEVIEPAQIVDKTGTKRQKSGSDGA